MHFYSVIKLEYEQALTHNFTLPDFCIQNVVKARFRPFPLFPMCNLLSVPEEAHRGLDGKIHITEGEL